jgi:hypothetical protein
LYFYERRVERSGEEILEKREQKRRENRKVEGKKIKI